MPMNDVSSNPASANSQAGDIPAITWPIVALIIAAVAFIGLYAVPWHVGAGDAEWATRWQQRDDLRFGDTNAVGYALTGTILTTSLGGIWLAGRLFMSRRWDRWGLDSVAAGLLALPAGFMTMAAARGIGVGFTRSFTSTLGAQLNSVPVAAIVLAVAAAAAVILVWLVHGRASPYAVAARRVFAYVLLTVAVLEIAPLSIAGGDGIDTEAAWFAPARQAADMGYLGTGLIVLLVTAAVWMASARVVPAGQWRHHTVTAAHLATTLGLIVLAIPMGILIGTMTTALLTSNVWSVLLGGFVVVALYLVALVLHARAAWDHAHDLHTDNRDRLALVIPNILAPLALASLYVLPWLALSVGDVRNFLGFTALRESSGFGLLFAAEPLTRAQIGLGLMFHAAFWSAMIALVVNLRPHVRPYNNRAGQALGAVGLLSLIPALLGVIGVTLFATNAHAIDGGSTARTTWWGVNYLAPLVIAMLVAALVRLGLGSARWLSDHSGDAGADSDNDNYAGAAGGGGMD